MRLKRINPEILLYHHFERSPSEFALYDDEFDIPVGYGSRNLVESIVRRLSKNVTVIYYKRDPVDRQSFKRKAVYSGDKKATSQKQPAP